MKRTPGLCFASLAFLLGSCAFVPPLPPEHRISIAEVAERVQCELRADVVHLMKTYTWLDKWSVGYTLTLKVEDEGSVSASSDFIDVLSAGTYTLGVNLGVTRFANRTATVKFSVSLHDLSLQTKACADPPLVPVRYFANGTGAGDWFRRAITAFDDKSDVVERPQELSQELEFAVKLTGGVSPSWVFVQYKPKAPVAMSRKDTHRLAIAFVKNASDRPTKVCVTNLPGAKPCDEPPPSMIMKVVPTPEGPKARMVPGPKGVNDATQDRIDRALDRLRNESVRPFNQ